MAQTRKHLIFSTGKNALIQFARFHRSQPHHARAQIELFHFSEHADVDMRKVDEAINEDETGTHAFVLLMVTSDSSYLWFNPTHYPKNVELCSTLRQRLGSRITFVVCPTNRSAEASWREHQLETHEIFGEFFSHPVEVWTGYDPSPNVTPDMGAVQSLVVAAPLQPQQQPQQAHEAHEQQKHPNVKSAWPAFCLPLQIIFFLICLGWAWMVHREREVNLSQLRHWNQKLQNKSDFLDHERARISNQKQTLQNRSDLLNQEQAKIDNENQTLQKRSGKLAYEEAAMTIQNQTLQKRSEKLAYEEAAMTIQNQTLQKRSEKLAREEAAMTMQNQTLQKRREKLDHEEAVMTIQNQTLQNRSEKLAREEAAMTMQNQTLEKRREKLDHESADLNQRLHKVIQFLVHENAAIAKHNNQTLERRDKFLDHEMDEMNQSLQKMIEFLDREREAVAKQKRDLR